MSRSSHFNTARQRSARWDDHHHTTISCWLQRSTPRRAITDHRVFKLYFCLKSNHQSVKIPISKLERSGILSYHSELDDADTKPTKDQNSMYSMCDRTKKTRRFKALIVIFLFIVQLLPQRHLQGHSRSWKWGSLGSSVDRRVVDGGWFPRFESVSDTS